MREILFRGKRKDYGAWVEGYYVHNFWNDGEDTIHLVDGGCCTVMPETVCQYTGLTDKNGRKIFENDFVSCRQYIGGNWVEYCLERGYVEMKHGAFGLHRIQGYYRPFKDWMEDYEYEVIGNIFDDPNLRNI